MTKNVEAAKDLRESMAVRKISGIGIELNSEEVDLVYEIFNDYIMRNDQPNVDAKLPFEIELNSGGVS